MQVVHFDNLASGFIVIASDGVWEFIDSQQAVDLIAKFISKGSTVCTRPLRNPPLCEFTVVCTRPRPRALLPLRTGAPPNAPAWPPHDMRGSRGVGDARAVRPLRALSDACRPDGRDCAHQEAVTKLIETAAAKWRQEEGDYRDDITAICIQICDGLFATLE